MEIHSEAFALWWVRAAAPSLYWHSLIPLQIALFVFPPYCSAVIQRHRFILGFKRWRYRFCWFVINLVEEGPRGQKWMIICIQQNYSAAANETLAGRFFKTCDGALGRSWAEVQPRSRLPVFSIPAERLSLWNDISECWERMRTQTDSNSSLFLYKTPFLLETPAESKIIPIPFLHDNITKTIKETAGEVWMFPWGSTGVDFSCLHLLRHVVAPTPPSTAVPASFLLVLSSVDLHIWGYCRYQIQASCSYYFILCGAQM